MGLFRTYAKFKMGKKIFDWARRKLSSGSTSRSGRRRTRV
jgi:hypothetical protein